MNLVLDTLKSRRSFRFLGNGLGLVAAIVLIRLMGIHGWPWAGALAAASTLILLEVLTSLADRKARRLRHLAPNAFPFKNLPEEDREFLQRTLLELPNRAVARTLSIWFVAFVVMSHFPLGDMQLWGIWGFAFLLLGAPVSALVQYFGNTSMGRRVAPFYYFEGDFADSLSKHMSTLQRHVRIFILAPLAVLLPFPIFLASTGLHVALGLPEWLWLIILAFATVETCLWVFKDIGISSIEDLGSALSRFGEGDFTALLDVTSGDALGVTTNLYNKTVRKIDRRFFVRENFGHMVVGEKTEQLFEGGLKLDGEEREIALLVCRVSGENLTIKAFNKFCSTIAECVDKHNGSIDEVSDGLVVALFGAPLKIENAEGEGLEAAKEIKERLDVFRAQQKMQAGLTLQTGLGFAFGKATLGLVGPKGRQRYTAMGRPVEEARRLSSL